MWDIKVFKLLCRLITWPHMQTENYKRTLRCIKMPQAKKFGNRKVPDVFFFKSTFFVTDHSHAEVSAATKLDIKWTNQKQYTYRKLTLCLINLLWSPSHIVLLLSWGNWKTPDKSQQRSCLRSIKVPQRHLLDHHKQPGLSWSETQSAILFTPPP